MDKMTNLMRVWLATPRALVTACVEALPSAARNPFLGADSRNSQIAVRLLVTSTDPTATAPAAHGNDTFGARERHPLAHRPRMVGV
ncbi:hypothetical protein [Mariniluteicoccus flavus]